jgi:hypothetical protein
MDLTKKANLNLILIAIPRDLSILTSIKLCNPNSPTLPDQRLMARNVTTPNQSVSFSLVKAFLSFLQSSLMQDADPGQLLRFVTVSSTDGHNDSVELISRAYLPLDMRP